jgi:hypothetical protein
MRKKLKAFYIGYLPKIEMQAKEAAVILFVDIFESIS